MVSTWFLFAVGEFCVMKCRPALAATSSNFMGAGEVDVSARGRLRARMKISSRMLRVEPSLLHAELRFLILHERVPNQAGALVFRHQHRDAEIDAEHVGVVPASQRIERIDQSVAPPGFAIALANGAQNLHAVIVK